MFHILQWRNKNLWTQIVTLDIHLLAKVYILSFDFYIKTSKVYCSGILCQYIFFLSYFNAIKKENLI